MSRKNKKAIRHDPSLLHAGHRQRLRGAFFRNGTTMYDHQLLELLLIHVLPRIDVNPIAHSLLLEFGSLENVFATPIDELTKIYKVGPKTARAIKASARIIAHINGSANENNYVRFKSQGEMNSFYAQYAMRTDAPAFLLFFNRNAYITDIADIAEDATDVDIDVILWSALNRNAYIASIVCCVESYLSEAETIMKEIYRVHGKCLAWQLNVMDILIIVRCPSPDIESANIYRPLMSTRQLPDSRIMRLAIMQALPECVQLCQEGDY